MPKLTSRTAIDAVAAGDLSHFVDISDTTDGAGGTSKKATALQIKTYVENNFTTLGVDKGGTGATTAATARTNLGVGAHPVSSTDDGVARYNGTTGDLQNSGVTIDDNNAIAGYLAPFNDQVGTTYTLLSTDTGKIITITNSSAITVNLPNSLSKGFSCTVIQGGTGAITFTAAGGATLNNRSGQSKTAGQHAQVALVVTGNSGGASAIYNLAGDTGA